MYGFARLPPIVQVGHHDAHAAIFFASPFEEAAVLVMDGYGDASATSAYIGSGNRLDMPLARRASSTRSACSTPSSPITWASRPSRKAR